MARVRFVSRADDLGSSHSANVAIGRVAKAGFIKNVSIMAPGPFVEEAADMLAGRKNVCFGMHTTLNAEWDKVKWKPVSPLAPDCGLLDENGYFLNDPSLFTAARPPVETIMKEVDAQLERLHKLGFDIRYIDSHMFPEAFVEGMDDSMREFAQKKGLVDHMYFYRLPPGLVELVTEGGNFLAYFKSLPEGQYFIVGHPSLDTPEMRQTGNATNKGEDIAKQRAGETKMYANPAFRFVLRLLGCEGIRYDEAVPPARATVQELKEALLPAVKKERNP